MSSRTLKRLCQCLGLASLILVVNYGDLLGGGQDARMHTPFPLTGLVWAYLADIALVTALLFLILTVAARTRFYPWVQLLFAILIPPYLVQRTQSFFPFDLIEGIVLVSGVVWGAVLLLLLVRFPRWYRRVLYVGGGIGAALVVFACSSIAQLLWVATWHPAPNRIDAAWNRAGEPPREHPRLVWIVFDELSYDQLFEHRARDLSVPNFDRLRAQSTLFTQTQPAGYNTVKIIPSLFTGQIIDGIRYNFANKLSVRHEADHQWVPIDGSSTLFAEAHAAGWRTAVVGWYNPYCSLYSSALDQCFWTNHDMFDGMTAQNAPLWTNVTRPLGHVARELVSPALSDRDLCAFDVRQRLNTEKDLQEHAYELLKTDQADFVFLHLAVPHSPNLWSRIRDDYTSTCGSSYLDNLALADKILGRLLGILGSSPRWPQTTLIVQGDHSWRIDAWNWLPAWTDEDETASRGVFDTRPAVLIHQAGQSGPATVSAPWPLIQMHDVIHQTLAGRVPVFANGTGNTP